MPTIHADLKKISATSSEGNQFCAHMHNICRDGGFFGVGFFFAFFSFSIYCAIARPQNQNRKMAGHLLCAKDAFIAISTGH